MSGFTGNDGSELVGGLNPSNVAQALSVDASGHLNVNASVSSGPTNITQVSSVNVGPANGLPVSGNNGGSLVVIGVDSSGRLILAPNTAFNVAQIGGATPQMDNTHELGVSLYGKGNGAAGDTPLLLDASGRVLIGAGGQNMGNVGIVNGANQLAIDASGRLTLVPNQALNIAQWNSSAPGASNPVITTDQIRTWIDAGQGYTLEIAETGIPANDGIGISLRANNIAKKVIVFRHTTGTSQGGGSLRTARLTGADAQITTAATPLNLNNGANTSLCTVTTNTAGSATVPGLTGILDFAYGGGNNVVEALLNGEVFIIEPNSTTGETLSFWAVMPGTGGSAFVQISWVEV